MYFLSSRFAFTSDRMTAAISATFARRMTRVVEPWPVALTNEFYDDAARSIQWRRFLQRTRLHATAPDDFALVGQRIRNFLEGPLRAVQLGNTFTATWSTEGHWE